MENSQLLLLFLVAIRFLSLLAFDIGPNFAANFIRSQLSMREIKDLTVVEIRDELRTRGERLSGGRAVLAKRLTNARTGKNLVQDEAEESDGDRDEEEEKGEEDGEEELKNNSFIDDAELEDSDDEVSVSYTTFKCYSQNESHVQSISHLHTLFYSLLSRTRKNHQKRSLKKQRHPQNTSLFGIARKRTSSATWTMQNRRLETRKDPCVSSSLGSMQSFSEKRKKRRSVTVTT